MDVRCEKCGTEYELDDRRLKPGGVTVKCTTCGHMFKVRQRSQTAVGVAVRAHSTPPAGGHDGPAGGHDGPAGRPERSSSVSQSSRRFDTAVGPMAANQAARDPVGQPVTPQPGRSGATPEALRGEGTSGPLGVGSGLTSKERTWMLRLPSGEIETCRELATLQQWIVSGKVLRASEISRNGRTWKRLGDIHELASFFAIADEARVVRRERSRSAPPPGARSRSSSGPPRPVRGSSAGAAQPSHAPAAAPPARPGEALAPPGRASPAVAGTEGTPEAAAARAPALPGPTASVAGNRAAASEGQPRRSMSDTGAGPVTSSKAAARAGAPAGMGLKGGDLEDDTWVGPARGPRRQSDATEPAGGVSRSVPAKDVAFAGKIKPLKDHFGSGSAGREGDPLDMADEAEAVPQERKGIGRWIVAASLVLMAGAAATVYLFVFRVSEPEIVTAAVIDASSAAVASDAAVAVSAPIDAAAPVVELPPDESVIEALAAAEEAVWADSRAGLEAAASELAALAQSGQADENIELVAERARVAAALAQVLLDEAAAQADAKEAKELQRQAEQQVLEARNLAKRALQLDRTHAGANIVMAEVLRLQGRRMREIDEYLHKVLKGDRRNREALLVRALALASDRQERKARRTLGELEAGAKGKDLRPTYRLALMDFAVKSFDDARRRAEEVLAVNAEHAGAVALADKIREALAVDTSDPMPPEEEDSEGGGATEASYDVLLGKAGSKRAAGKCDDALSLYERALDENPTGVEALTGMGDCHLQRRELASAYDKFKAALVVSSRHQEAMLGIARMYELQGRKEQAVEEYQRFLDAHPNSGRAAEVKQRIERLGVGGAGSGAGPAGSGTEPASSGTEPAGSGTEPVSSGTAEAPAGSGDSSTAGPAGSSEAPAIEPAPEGSSGESP